MDDTERARYRSSLGDLYRSMANLYPAYLRAGVGYWTEMAANGSSYYLELLECMVAAWQRPEHAERLFARGVERLKTHMQWTGDATERAILEFNQSLIAPGRRAEPTGGRAGEHAADALLDLADAAASAAWSSRAADVRVLRREFEAILEKLRRLDEQSPGQRPAPSGA
jgi:hypothetical protein